MLASGNNAKAARPPLPPRPAAPAPPSPQWGPAISRLRAKATALPLARDGGGGGFVLFAGSAAQRQEMIPAIAAGTLRLAFAHTERQARYDLADVATTAKPVPGGFVLGGHKGVVLHGEGADRIIVSARTAGGPREAAGISLFLVDPQQAGVSVRGYPTVDGLRAPPITFSDAKLDKNALLGAQDQALPIIARAVDLAIAALAAEAVGAMTVMHELTVEYLKTRKPFAVAIGSFPALQHPARDLLVALG